MRPLSHTLRQIPWLLAACTLWACFDGAKLRRCDDGDVVACACGEDSGQQRCGEDGTYGSCDCSGDGGTGQGGCDDTEQRACSCIDGAPGAQLCQDSGAFGPCDCEPAPIDAGDPVGPPGCVDDIDSDDDGLLDCQENADGDTWTDADTFNGVRVSLRDGCDAKAFAGGCDPLLNPQALDSCLVSPVLQSVEQHGGWDFGSAASGASCAGAYGFAPGFDTCADPFQVLAEGTIQLQTGRHCFFISNGRSQGCAAMYLSRDDVDAFGGWATTEQVVVRSSAGGDTACVPLDAGIYPIRWFFNMWGPDNAMRLRYCFSRSGDCAPGRAIPSGMLRASVP